MSSPETNAPNPDDAPGEYYLQVYLPGVPDEDVARLARQIVDLVLNVGGTVLHTSLPSTSTNRENTTSDGG